MGTENLSFNKGDIMATSMVHKDVFVKSRIDNDLKEQAASVLGDCGLNLSSAVRLFLEQVVINQGLPFQINRTPSAMSRRALAEARVIEEGFKSIDDLIEGLDSARTEKKLVEH